uniref:hypothetical protein n=1 Tax=Flavobacterium sp. TaxID=239 RepID=UPI00404A1541
MILNKKQIQNIRGNWIKASVHFKFKIISPYAISQDDGIKEVFAFLPEYGSSNGMIVELIFPPEYHIDKALINWSKQNEKFYSFINIENFLEYDEIYFKEALEDWAKF